MWHTHTHTCETCTTVRFRACLSPPCSHSWLVLPAHQPPQTLMCSICHVWPRGVNLHYINFNKKGITHNVPYFEGSDFSKIVSKCILVLSCIHIVAYLLSLLNKKKHSTGHFEKKKLSLECVYFETLFLSSVNGMLGCALHSCTQKDSFSCALLCRQEVRIPGNRAMWRTCKGGYVGE